MQDFSSTVSFSPSFSFYASGNGDIVETAVRVTRESQSYYSVRVDGDDNDTEFKFETSPLRDESFFHFPMKEKYDDVAASQVNSKNLLYGGWNINIDPSPSSPSQSRSSSETEDLEDVSSRRYYCFWSPIRSPKTKSSSTQKRCRLKDLLLRRSQSDGAVTTSSESKRCRFKDLMIRSRSDGGVRSSVSPSGNGSSPMVKGKSKTPSYRHDVYKKRMSYLPYRQDLIGVFAGMSRLRH